jgi:hypothetical protein
MASTACRAIKTSRDWRGCWTRFSNNPVLGSKCH